MEQLNMFLTDNFRKQNKKIECIVKTNSVSNGNSLPFKIGDKVVAEWINHIGLAEFKRPAGKTIRKNAVKKVTNKKINGKEINNFVVDKKEKHLFCV